MDAKQFSLKSKEYDRQIKECRRAAFFALSLEEKLEAINRLRQLTNEKIEFRRKK